MRFDSRMPIARGQWCWSPNTAYAVGLIATDGNIGARRPIVSFTSSEAELISLFARPLEFAPRPYRKPGGFGTWASQVAVWDRPLHSWLVSVGLMPRKTLSLAGIEVPQAYMAPLARGLLDGDGTILSYWRVPNRRQHPGHRNLRLTTRFYSASLVHLGWLAVRLHAAFGIRGSIGVDTRKERKHPLYHLQFAKRASRSLLSALYADESAPRLDRKYARWMWFLENEVAFPPRAVRNGKIV